MSTTSHPWCSHHRPVAGKVSDIPDPSYPMSFYVSNWKAVTGLSLSPVHTHFRKDVHVLFCGSCEGQQKHGTFQFSIEKLHSICHYMRRFFQSITDPGLIYGLPTPSLVREDIATSAPVLPFSTGSPFGLFISATGLHSVCTYIIFSNKWWLTWCLCILQSISHSAQ